MLETFTGVSSIETLLFRQSLIRANKVQTSSMRNSFNEMDFNSTKLYNEIKKIFSVIERSMNSFWFLQRVKVYVKYMDYVLCNK